MKLVTAVRPYAPRIRKRVFDHMAKAGCPILPENVIAAGTADAEAVRFVLTQKSSVLLVPFHAHRDTEGRKVDGLTFLGALDQASVAFVWHVVMPVSTFATPAVTAMFTRGDVPARARDRILLLQEDELDDPAATERIRRHVGS
jgi:hypothetical protein